ncbi:MAG: hypothetical protein AAF399_25480, partial [Bacteroidota bacterium]
MRSYFILLLGFLLFNLHASAQIFVDQDATGLGDGSSWLNAYTDLAMAIDSASANAEIWIAEGTYLPGDTNTATFSITQDLQLYGGFDGTEILRSERDPVLHPTILSGDIVRDDVDGDLVSNRSDNTKHVLTVGPLISQATIIAGLTILGGQADSPTNPFGGGVNCQGSPIFRNCVFTNNFATENGGAININGSSAANIRFESCQFLKNQAGARGGA